MELTYIQAIPLGASDIRASSSGADVRQSQHQGLHDVQVEMGFTLREGSPVRLSFQWTGGLEVSTQPEPALSQGARSGGVRILDFTMDGDEWVLEVEGEGGSDGRVNLFGSSVSANEEGVEVMEGEPGRAVLQMSFPGGESRSLRTLRLFRSVPGS